MSAVEAELEALLELLREARGSDPPGAAFLAAYVARYAERLPAELRAKADAALGADAPTPGDPATADPTAGRPAPSDSTTAPPEGAERYARLRTVLEDLARRAAGSGSYRASDDGAAAARERLRARSTALQVVGQLALAGAIAAIALWGDATSLLVLVLLVAFGLASFVAGLALARRAERPASRDPEQVAAARRAADARAARTALLGSDDGRWLRDLVARHPVLGFADVQPPTGRASSASPR